ncbi:hypothetical protein DS67_08305 [Mesotoga sp. SC_4PWA21]|nr:hypothetical protein EU77_04125 [Mesotoga sp. SC_NapDC]RAM60534.1 hypothetical protein DS67_08305 [Mesotoga sp. SC_4PWA21]
MSFYVKHCSLKFDPDLSALLCQINPEYSQIRSVLTLLTNPDDSILGTILLTVAAGRPISVEISLTVLPSLSKKERETAVDLDEDGTWRRFRAS